MKKLICDLCKKETDNLYDIEVIYDVKKITDGHTYKEENKEVCADCQSIYKYERHKAMERVYKKLRKTK